MKTSKPDNGTVKSPLQRLEEFLREVPGNPRAPEARAMLRELASLR